MRTKLAVAVGVVVLAAALLKLAASAHLVELSSSRDAQRRGLTPCLKDRNARPERFPLRPLPGFTLSKESRALLLEQAARWCQIKSNDVAIQVHALRLRNLIYDAGNETARRFSDNLLRSILDDREYGKHGAEFPMLFDTPYGAAYRIRMYSRPGEDAVGGMTHVDKVLSTMGELGYDLSVDLVTHSGRHHPLADVLEDSLKRWHPGRESEWTLIAYCSYLRRQRDWVDAGGRAWTADDVLSKVLRRHDQGPCSGTHRLYGLARACMRARSGPGFFSPALVHEAEEVLRRASRTLAASQAADGSWDVGWESRATEPGAPPPAPTDPRLILVITGHMLEWFAVADPDLRPPPQVIERAARHVLRHLCAEPVRHFGGPFLPGVTHAVRGLIHLEDVGTPRSAPIGVLR